MTVFHRDWALVVTVLNLAGGIYGVVLCRRKAPVPITRAFWRLLIAAQTALLLQVAVGVILIQHRQPHNRLHPFYGFVLLIAAVLSYAFRGEGARRALLVFTIVELFIGVVSVRAILTGFG